MLGPRPTVPATPATVSAPSRPSAARDQLDDDHVRALIESLGPIVRVLEDAQPAAEAELYAGLGLRLTHRQARNPVAVEADPVACAGVRVGGRT